MNAIELEILWSNLISTVSEQAKALQRIAFSAIVREAGDLATALFDARGRLVVQATTGTPGHINCIAHSGRKLVEMFEGRLEPGDVVITNDPWLAAGHFFDITMITPVFHKGRIIGYFGSTIHHTDIGGYGVGAGARDVHEEGLWIPPLKLLVRGEPEPVLHDVLRHNVRIPEQLFGDLSAQVSSGRTGADRLIRLLATHGLDDIDDLAEEIISRSEEATRASIRKLTAGTWHGETTFDAPGGEQVTIKVAITVDPIAGDMLLDFTGSSPASRHGINCVFNYSHAYAAFAARSCLNPELPNNVGSLAPIRMTAPEGCIVNCKYPVPVNARHVVGMYMAMPVMKALYGVMPERVLAEGSGAVWTVQVQGERSGKTFVSYFNYSGGMGARAHKPGPSATCYPAGVAAVPVEILEASIPILFLSKQLRDGSGGAGRSRGGDGQAVAFKMLTDRPWVLSAVPCGVESRPEGLEGGGPGKPGSFQINGTSAPSGSKIELSPDDVVLLETPGGGGFGAPPARPR